MEFEWDPKKAKQNLKKHKTSFDEASTVFNDDLSITFPDPDHSEDEDHLIIIGMSKQKRLLMVAHTERGVRIRIINARELTRTERKDYEEEIKATVNDDLRPEYANLRQLLRMACAVNMWNATEQAQTW